MGSFFYGYGLVHTALGCWHATRSLAILCGTYQLLGMDLGEHLAQSLRIAVVVLTVLAGTSLVLLLGSVYLSKSRLLRHLVLFKVQAPQQGYTARTYPVTLIGQQGIAQTPLRPAGKVTIQGTRYDAKSPGTYVAPGTAVVVTDVAGTSLVVQAIAWS